jgi:hypothetical protein
MSTTNAFTPQGQTYVISTSSVQVKTQDNVYAVSYRVRNLLSGAAYLGWAPANPLGVAVTVPSAAAPSAGSPAKVLGFLPNSVEVVQLPPNVWLLASASNAFEVTPGEGM